MSRTPRRSPWTNAACYDLLNRGHNRDGLFADDADQRAFLDLMARSQQHFGLRLSRW